MHAYYSKAFHLGNITCGIRRRLFRWFSTLEIHAYSHDPLYRRSCSFEPSDSPITNCNGIGKCDRGEREKSYENERGSGIQNEGLMKTESEAGSSCVK